MVFVVSETANDRWNVLGACSRWADYLSAISINICRLGDVPATGYEPLTIDL